MANRVILFFLFLLLLSGCESAEDYYSAGLDHSLDGDLRTAIVNFNKAINKNLYLKDAYIQLGAAYESLNKPDSALMIYDRLLKMYPENTAANYYSGICLYKKQEYLEAAGFFTRALDSKGGFNVADTASIQTLIDLNKDQFESESPEVDIPIREILYDRAMSYFKAGQLKKATADFSGCILQHFNPDTSHYMIGLCHLARKDRKNARHAFVQASSYGDSLAIKRLKTL